MTSVAVLGTGTMGGPMARRLAAAGFAVRAWNPTRARAERIQGATVADTPADAARGADVLLTMAPDGPAVEKTVFDDGVADAAPAAVWLQMSTVGVAAADRLGELAAQRGLTYVDAPVGGSKAAAENGQLIVLASGPDDARARADEVFAPLAAKTIWLGAAGTGTRMKLVFNNWVFAVVESVAESIELAKGLGVDANDFLRVVDGTHLDTPYLQLKGRMIIEQSFEPAFKLALARKDAHLIADAARAAGLSLPVTETALTHFDRAVELGHGDDDMSALAFALAEQS